MSVETTGDYNNDGIDDLLWQKTNGATQVWLMDNTANRASIVYLPTMNTSYSIQSAGDFDKGLEEYQKIATKSLKMFAAMQIFLLPLLYILLRYS